MSSRLPGFLEGNRRVLDAATAICLALGLAFLALISAPSDSIWYFHARDLLDGRRLYSDLHLVQQPVFVLVNALGMGLFGESVLGQRLVFVLVLAAYVWGIRRLVDRVDAPPTIRAIVLLAVFGCAIHFEAYRFDDYSAFEGMLVLALLNLLPGVGPGVAPRANRIRSIAIGIVLGLAILTRINDGLALTIAVCLILPLRDPTRRVMSLMCTLLAASITMLAVLAVIRETPAVWLRTTVLDAMAIKGGGGVLRAPFVLIGDALQFSLDQLRGGFSHWLAGLVVVALTCWHLARVLPRRLSGIGPALGVAAVLFLTMGERRIDLILVLGGPVLLALVTLGLWRFGQCVLRCTPARLRDECLLLVPLALYGAGAMSSGGSHYGLYFPMAMALLVAAIGVRRAFWSSMPGAVVLMAGGYLALSGLLYRIDSPYGWHCYRVEPLFEPRELMQTPLMGPILMDRPTHEFIAPICKALGDGQAELLSLPLPYANYICGLRPWHGYVQTFFDLTTAQTIDRLVGELQAAPPQFILYQRQLANLRSHERVYNHGDPLPHRRLDVLIMENLQLERWHVIRRTQNHCSDWLLIDTRQSGR